MKPLLIAFGMVLILEGVPWFLSPGGMRRAIGQLSELPDSVLRVAALGSMGAGLLLVDLVTG